jgi:type IV pilus assembly protein PilN
VILVNLLPHREAKRRLRKQTFYIGLGIGAGIGLLIVATWYSVVLQMTSVQTVRIAYLESEIKRQEGRIKDIATLKTEIEGLKARQRAVEDLQTNRNIPVYLLDELVRQTPEGVYLTSIKQVGERVSIAGVAQTNERVSEFLRNTQHNSQWLDHPELIEIKAVSVQSGRETRRLFDFSLAVSLKRPGVAAAASAAASAPASMPASALPKSA